MKRDTRLISIRNTPMVIFEPPECISDDIVKYRDFWEFELFAKWCNYFPENGFYLDIGANIGSHCLQFKENYPNIQIWAFEPFTENFNLLRQNTKRYFDVHCFNVGVGEKNTMVYFNDGHESNSGVVQVVNHSENSNLVVALDNLEFPSKVDFIKLDVEGYEVNAIKGMVNLLKKDKPMLWVEDNPHTAIPFLEQLGYRVIEKEETTNDYLLA